MNTFKSEICRMKRVPIILVLFIATSLYARVNDNKPFVLGYTEVIQSAELGESRTLNIYLPPAYNRDSSYPVIYLLDGSADEDFIHIAGLIQFFTMNGAISPPILVGIGNVDRKRDFTFPTSIEKDKKAYPTTGGSERFIAFLEKDLEPYIVKHYRTNGHRTIIGQSLGGLVATEILLKKPELFDRYIIVSPSLWWDTEYLLHRAPDLLARQSDRKINVYISIGTEGKQMEDDAKKLVDVLHASGKKNLTVDFVPLPDENHLTILHEAVYRALDINNPKKQK